MPEPGWVATAAGRERTPASVLPPIPAARAQYLIWRNTRAARRVYKSDSIQQDPRRRAVSRGDSVSFRARAAVLATLAMVLLVLAGCGGGGGSSGASGPTIPSAGPGDTGNYFPLALGDRWGFNVALSDAGQPPVSHFEAAQITGTKSLWGYSTFALTYAGEGSGDPYQEYYYKNGAGVFHFGDNSADPVVAAIGPYQLVAFPLQVNASLVQVNKTIDLGDDLDGDGLNETMTIRSEVKVIGFESVVVEAGTFSNCVRLRTDVTETLTLSDSGFEISATGAAAEWYAPGIGLVKRHSELSSLGLSSVSDYALASYGVGGLKSETIPPTVNSVTPDANTVLLTASIQAVFSEEIDPFSLDATSFTLRDAADQAVAGAVSYLEKTATFTPSAPLAGGIYFATLTTGVQDVAGNPLQADYSWSFSVDRTAPTVVSTSPPANAATVPPSASISVTFSEDIDPASLDPYSAFAVSGGGGLVPGSITYSNKTATFLPAAALNRNTLYTVTLSTAVRDIAGNHLAGAYTFSFTVDPGLFQSYLAFPTGSRPEAVAIGDVNGDGRNDVVMTTSFYFDAANDYKVFVFLQNADGTLAPPIKYPTGSSYVCMAQTASIGDVDHDGRNDVVIGNSGCGIEVFLQDSGGALGAGVSYPSVDSSRVRIADLNNDGLLDVVGIGWGTDTASVWLQNAGGTLESPLAYGVLHGGYDDLEVGDVNGDGLPDIVVMSGQLYADPNVGVLTQKAGGGFNAPAYYSVGTDLLSAGVAFGDVNGDSANDVVVTYGGNSPGSKIGVFLQNGSGTLHPVVSHISYDSPKAVEIAEVTGDGRKDVVVVHSGWFALGVYRQLPGGTLQAEEMYAAPYGSDNPHGLAIGDINGDGQNDIVTTDFGQGLVVFYHR